MRSPSPASTRGANRQARLWFEECTRPEGDDKLCFANLGMQRFASLSKGNIGLSASASGDGLAIFGVVNVDQPPLPRFSAVDLGFDAMRGHCRSVFPHRRMKTPVEFRPRRVAAHVDRYTVRLKIAGREHTAHYVLKDLLLDGIETVLLAQRIDERDIRRVRPDLREQVQIYSIHSFRVLLDEVVDGRDVPPRAGVGLGGGVRGHDADNSGEQKANGHGALPVYPNVFAMRR